MAGDALENLAVEASTLGAESGPDAAPGADQAGPVPESPNYRAIGFMLSAFVQLATALLKVESLKRTLGETEVEQCAKVLAPVADKYGVNLSTMFDGPEGVALMVAGPILWNAATQLQDELRARKAKPVEPSSSSPPSADDAP